MDKHERKKIKKEEKRQTFEREKRKKALQKWLKISVISLVLLAGMAYLIFFRWSVVSHAGTLRIAKTEHNFGLVPVQGGAVDIEIPLVNIGEGALTITSLETSCGCTRASIVNQGKEGPTFGMAGHGSNPKDWRTIVQPGEQAVVKIYYDPATHPDLRGPITRVVTIRSDDPTSPKQEVRIKVNQIG